MEQDTLYCGQCLREYGHISVVHKKEAVENTTSCECAMGHYFVFYNNYIHIDVLTKDQMSSSIIRMLKKAQDAMLEWSRQL